VTSRELFDRAIEVVLEHEGEAYTDNPLDRGGPTKFGIAQRWNPDLDVKSLTRTQAIEVYWERYWRGHRHEFLPEAIAIKVFDLAVNLGNRTAACSACCSSIRFSSCSGSGKMRSATPPATFPRMPRISPTMWSPLRRTRG
jgi:hypothetical protein